MVGWNKWKIIFMEKSNDILIPEFERLIKLGHMVEFVPKGVSMRPFIEGGYDKVYEAGTLICGGHSIYDDEPKYGLCVTGFAHPDKIYTNSGAKAGDKLIYTKPLGIGIITTAQKADIASDESIEKAVQAMTFLNKSARDCMVNYEVHACTDVTGYG